MARPAKLFVAPLVFAVAPRTTITKINVRIISASRPFKIFSDAQALAPVAVPRASPGSVDTSRASNAAAMMPPIT